MPVSVTASTAAAAGAVDEELFIKSFEDVPKVKVSLHLVHRVFLASGFVCVHIILHCYMAVDIVLFDKMLISRKWCAFRKLGDFVVATDNLM